MTYHHTPGHPVADIYAHAWIWDEEEYHHTPAPPHVWDIYENYLKRKEFLQSVADGSEKWNSAMRRLGDRLRRLPAFSPRRKQSVHATEHPIEAEEGVEQVLARAQELIQLADRSLQWDMVDYNGEASRRVERLRSALARLRRPGSFNEEDWLGSTDSESDDPGGWAR